MQPQLLAGLLLLSLLIAIVTSLAVIGVGSDIGVSSNAAVPIISIGHS